MKNRFRVSLIVLVFLFWLSYAHAGFFTIEAENPLGVIGTNQIYVAEGQIVDFNLLFTPTADDGFISTADMELRTWNLQFSYDSDELLFIDPQSDDYGLGFSEFEVVDDGAGSLHVVATKLGGEGFGFPEGDDAPVTLVTLSFTVLDDNLWDGASDFDLLSQLGAPTGGPDLRGLIFLDSLNMSEVYQFNGAIGVDVGLPIPGSLWLLGSALIGIASLMKKIRI